MVHKREDEAANTLKMSTRFQDAGALATNSIYVHRNIVALRKLKDAH